MATWLKNLKIREVSFVDKAANPHAQILFYKRDGGTAEERIEIAKKWMEESVQSIMDDDSLSSARKHELMIVTGLEFTKHVREEISTTVDASALAGDVYEKVLNPNRKKKPKQETEAERIARHEEEMKATMRNHGMNGPHRKLEGTNKTMKYETQNDAVADVEKYVQASMVKGERYEDAVTRLLQNDEVFRKAWRAIRTLPSDVAKGGIRSSVTPDRIAKRTTAYERLEQLAVDLRKREPSLTKEKAFERVYVDNPDLVKSHKRELIGGV